MIFQVEAHFNEEETQASPPLVCVAGYLIERVQARHLRSEWNDLLNWRKLPRPLRAFRMSHCESGSGEFQGLDPSLRAEVTQRIIDITKRRTLLGVAVTVDKAQFDRFMPRDRAFVGTAHSLCVQVVLAAVAGWIDAQQRVDHAGFFFEAGHDSQAETDWIMSALARNPRAVCAHRYVDHAFLPQVGNPGLQAAGMLCWQWRADRMRQMAGGSRREDCATLLQHPHQARHVGPDTLQRLARRIVEIRGPLTREAFLFGGAE